jgi:hypothetical protein
MDSVEVRATLKVDLDLDTAELKGLEMLKQPPDFADIIR